MYIVHKVCSVYKNRGYVTVAEIQDLLDTYNASLVETNRVFQHLIEAGCKISENSTNDGDFKFYDESTSNIKDDVDSDTAFGSYANYWIFQFISRNTPFRRNKCYFPVHISDTILSVINIIDGHICPKCMGA